MSISDFLANRAKKKADKLTETYIASAQNLTNNQKTRLEEVRRSILEDVLIYYPQVPKSVDEVLESYRPKFHHSGTRFQPFVQKGDFVAEGQTIGTYGSIRITTEFAGRIDFLGGTKGGLHEWPDLPGMDNRVPYEDSPEKWISNNYNQYAVVYPNDIQPEEAYTFAIRPILGFKEKVDWGRYLVRANSSFDHGNVWQDMKKERGFAFYSVIDLSVYNLKGGSDAIPVPDLIRNNAEANLQLKKYWQYINQGEAALAKPNELPVRNMDAPPVDLRRMVFE